MINKHGYIHGCNRHTDKSAVEEEWDPLMCVRAAHNYTYHAI